MSYACNIFIIAHACFSALLPSPCAFEPSLPHLRDRFRTVTNVLGDSIGAGIVEHLSRHELLKNDPEICSSVVEEAPKKSYHLVCQENERENQAHPDTETKM